MSISEINKESDIYVLLNELENLYNEYLELDKLNNTIEEKKKKNKAIILRERIYSYLLKYDLRDEEDIKMARYISYRINSIINRIKLISFIYEGKRLNYEISDDYIDNLIDKEIEEIEKKKHKVYVDDIPTINI